MTLAPPRDATASRFGDAGVVAAQLAVLGSLGPWVMSFIVAPFLGDSPHAPMELVTRLQTGILVYPFAVLLGLGLSVALRRRRRSVRLLALLLPPGLVAALIVGPPSSCSPDACDHAVATAAAARSSVASTAGSSAPLK